MEIVVTAGTGTGPTQLAAFDAALLAAGVANFNLIVLSSVIPPGARVVDRDESIEPAGIWGDRLYVVLAQERTTTHNADVWAGLGWVQDANTGRGLFVEHHGPSRNEVERDIADSLTALTAKRGLTLGSPQMKLAGLTCEHEAACALVLATYGSAPW